MSNDQTERAEDIYCSALEIKSLDERKVFLDRACRGDADFRLEVDRWLAVQPAADKFFQENDVARLLTETFCIFHRICPQRRRKAMPAGRGQTRFPARMQTGFKMRLVTSSPTIE